MMAYQQNTYDYYSQYPTTQASSYSSYSDPSQSYPSENAYSTTSSVQGVASYQGYSGTDTNTSTDYASTSSANQGSYPYQSYSDASSYDYSNVAGQSNYSDTQTSAPGVTYGSYSDYSQSNTSNSSVAQPTGSQSQYYTPSQNQSQGQYYAGYTSTTTTTTTTETNQPSNVAQYTQYVPHDSGGYENINKPPDQTSYSYYKANETNNAGPNFNSHLQTQDWSQPNQGQGTSLAQSSTYSNAAPQNMYVSTQPQANAEHQQTDQSYYYNYNQTSTSGDGYNQGAAQISSQSDAYKPTQTQDYGSQSKYGSRPGDGFTQPNRSANVNQTYQAPSHTDWNTGNIASNQPTVSQFSGQSGSSWNSKNNRSNSAGSRFVSQYSQKGSENRNQFGQRSQNTAGSGNSKFSAKGGYLSGIQSTETRTVPEGSRKQMDFGDKREPWHAQENQQRGNGSKLSNLRPIMPSSYPSGTNSKAQPVKNTRPEQTHLKQKSFNSSTGNQTNKVGKGDNKNARTQNYSSQSTGNIRKNLPQKLNNSQIGQGVKQVSAGQDKMGPKGPGPSSPRGLGPISSARSGHRSKRGHDQSQPMQHDKVTPCGPGPFSPRFPAAMPPRGPPHMQQRGNNWMPPRGPDHMMLTGPGARQAGPFNMAPRGPPVRPHRGPVPMPPRVPLPMPPRGPGGMHSPKVGPPPRKRQHSMEGGGKFDKWSRREPSPLPMQMGRPGRPPFGPMAPHDNRFRFRTPNEGEMFGPRFRGHPNESFPGGPRGLRPRMPFRPRPPVPWGRAPPGFPPRPRGPHWQDIPDLGPQSPPPMLGHPRKRRRSSGSPHRGGEPMPLMAVRPTNVPRDGPTLFDPRVHQSQPFHPESFRDLQPPKLPNKMTIPQFMGTKAGTFGKYLTEIKRKLEIEQRRSQAKIDAKKSQDVKFLCDVCQVGFTTKEEDSEHRNQHKQCDVEGCRFEGISKVLEIHKQQAHQPNIPAVKWSRDTDDVKAWLEERKRNFPTTANITAKKAVDEDKERVGAVLVTKEFGKMRGKKKKIIQTTEGGNEETKEDETTEENEVKEQEEEAGEKEAMATSDEEGTSKDKTDEKGEVEMEKPEQKEVEKNKIEDAVEKKEEENMTVDEDLPESNDKEVATEDKSGDQENISDLTESTDKEVATENKSGDKEDISDLTESTDKEVATESKSGGKEDISVTKEVIFQRVKKEVVRRFKGGKGSKREAWRNSRPIKKGVPAPGGRHSKVTLLEMLLAPEMRHERNLVLQCVRHTVNNNFFEPKEVAETKDVGSKNKTIPPVPKERTASDEEQNVEIGTGAREDEDGGKVDKGMSSSKLKDEDINKANEIEDMACEEDGKVHQEEVEMRDLTDESVKGQMGDGKGDDSCSTGTIGLSVGVSDPEEKSLLIGEEKETLDLGDEKMMVDNHDDHGKERDADSEKLQLGTDEDIDASNGKDKVAVKTMEDKFVLVEDMDDSGEVGMPVEQKMETSEGQQELKLTEEVAASVDDDVDGDDDDQGGIGEAFEEATQEGTTHGGSEMSTIEVMKEIGDPEDVEADTNKQKVDVEEQFEVRDEDMIRADDKIRVQGDAEEEVAEGTENSEEDEAQKECMTSETRDELMNKCDGSSVKAADEEEQAVVDDDTEIDETVKTDEQKPKEEDEGKATEEVEVHPEEEEKGKQEETTEEIDKSQEPDENSGVKPKKTVTRRSSRRKR